MNNWLDKMEDFDFNKLPKALSEDEREQLRYLSTGERALALIDALTEQAAQQAAQIVLDGQRIAELEARAEVLRRTSVVGQLEARVRELEAERDEASKQLAIERQAVGTEADIEAGRDPVEAARALRDSLNSAGDEVFRLSERVRELEAENDRLDEAFEDAAEERQYAESRAEAAEQELADANALLGELEPVLQTRGYVDTADRLRAHLAAPSRTSCIHHGTHHCLHHAAPSRTEAEAYERWLERIARLSDAERAVLDAMRAVATTTLQQAVAPRENNPLGKLHGPCAAELARRGLK